jgi:hypothetical protein
MLDAKLFLQPDRIPHAACLNDVFLIGANPISQGIFCLNYEDQSLREFRNDLGLHVKYRLFLPGFQQKWKVSIDSGYRPEYEMLRKSARWESY